MADLPTKTLVRWLDQQERAVVETLAVTIYQSDRRAGEPPWAQLGDHRRGYYRRQAHAILTNNPPEHWI